MLFTFPSRYLFTIGHWLVFSLTPWSALGSREISRVSRYSGFPPCEVQCRLRASHPLWRIIPHASPMSFRNYADPTTPLIKSAVWAVPHSLAATNGITLRFLFHRVLRCFTSPSICWPNCFGRWRIPAIGYPIRRSTGHRSIQLSVAYRSFSRPSSHSSAKAFPIRLLYFDQFYQSARG